MTPTSNSTVVNSRDFRNVMGLFATGVTVIATEVNGDIHGMTANAITSVSLDPLLILVCVQRDANMANILREAGQFSINILNENQADLSNYFAGIWTDAAPPSFSFESWVGGPRLEGAIGALACEVDQFLEGGDHWIITARVVDLYNQRRAGNPLLYYTGQYRQLGG